MVGKKKASVTERAILGPPRPKRVQLIRLLPGSMIRLAFFASMAVLGSVYAIYRHYTVLPARMLVPAAPAASEVEIEP